MVFTATFEIYFLANMLWTFCTSGWPREDTTTTTANKICNDLDWILYYLNCPYAKQIVITSSGLLY